MKLLKAISERAGEGGLEPHRDAAPVNASLASAPAAVAPANLVVGFFAVLVRDLRIGARSAGEWLNPLFFFVLTVTLFPLGIGPSAQTLVTIAPGVLWVAALLAMLLSLDTLFERDLADGVLEQFALSATPLSVVVLAKVIAHWLSSGLPLVLLSPLLALLFDLPVSGMPTLVASLALGTFSLSLIGAIGAALVVGLNRGGVLLSLLVLPLIVPILIFGSSATAAAAGGFETGAAMSLLAAIAAAAVALAPLASAAALRIGLGGPGQG